MSLLAMYPVAPVTRMRFILKPSCRATDNTTKDVRLLVVLRSVSQPGFDLELIPLFHLGFDEAQGIRLPDKREIVSMHQARNI